MIQRIQTLFLSAIVALSSVLFFMPFQIIKDGANTYLLSLMPGSLINIIKPTIYGPMALNFIIIFLSLATIFNFKKRRKQMKYAQVILVLSTLLIGSLFMFPFIKAVSADPIIDYTIFSFIPAINIVLAFLARYFIKKDEDLVRSSNRIR